MIATRPQGSSDIIGPSVGQPVVSRVDSNGSRTHDAESKLRDVGFRSWKVLSLCNADVSFSHFWGGNLLLL